MTNAPCPECAALELDYYQCREWHDEIGDLVETYAIFEANQPEPDTDPDTGLYGPTSDE